MTDVKTRPTSPDEWHELLKPYGWADVTACAPTWAAPSAAFTWYEIRVMLSADPDGDLDEWVRRSDLLDQARRAVKAVQAKGYMFMNAPRIEFGGQYKYRVDRGAVPEWFAEAELSFCVHAT